MKKIVKFKQQAGRALRMLLRYHNWPTALADRLGFIPHRPVLYRLRDGVSFVGYTASLDVRLINEIWLDCIYDTGMASAIQPDWTILDLGANKGYFSVRAASLASRVISVEPNPSSHALCLANITLNNMGDKIVLHQAAVAATRGQITFHIAEDSADCSVLDLPTLVRKITVDAVTAEDLIGGIERIDLLKMDIEGAELDLLLDPHSDAWLKKVTRIAMEYHPSFYEDASRVAMVERLESIGFHVITSPERAMMYARKSGS
ncbi:MAG: FkbM family methyltransferase [Verrucomicrobiota bacterium]